MNEDFSPADFPVSWAEQVRNQLLTAMRKASRSFETPSSSPEQVHRARRFLKEANALALLLERCVGPPAAKAARELRSVRRKLGDTRDFDVMLESLARFAPSLDGNLVAELREEIEDRRRIAAGAALVGAGPDLLRELRRVGDETKQWPIDAEGASELILALKTSYRRARRRGERAFASKLPGDLHDLRKASILHRAQREAFEQAWPKLMNAWCSEAQNLRDALGGFNDLAVLAAFAAARENAEARTAPLLSLIEHAQASVVARAEPIFRRLFCARSKELARQMEVLLASPKKWPKAASPRGSASPQVGASDGLKDRRGVNALT